MIYKSPYGDEYTTLEHLPDNFKQDLEEWIAEARKNVDNFWMKDKSDEYKEAYLTALNHLHSAMEARMWI